VHDEQVEEAYIGAEEFCARVRQEEAAVLRAEPELLQALRFDLVTFSPFRALAGFLMARHPPLLVPVPCSADSACIVCNDILFPHGLAPAGCGANPKCQHAIVDELCDAIAVLLLSISGSVWPLRVLSVQDLEACGSEPGAGGLEPKLAALAGEAGGLARVRGAAVAATDALMLTDAPLLFPPGQLALAGLRSGVRKVVVNPRMRTRACAGRQSGVMNHELSMPRLSPDLV